MRRLHSVFLALLLLLPLALPKALHGEERKAVFVPNYFDPQHRLTKPDMDGLTRIRFVTEDDYPPFHFAMPDGSLAGFDIDLARAVCEELKVACTIQARRFDLLAAAIDNNEADALLASLRIDAQSREKFDFTAPYYATPGRFVTQAKSALDTTPEGLAGKRVGVIARTAHEAYVATFFPKAQRKAFPDRKALREALRKAEIDAFFDDAISSSFWLAGTDSQNCCAFRGGPYTESRFFGEGVGFAVKKGNGQLRRALDYALAVLAQKGTYTDLYLKYFPIGFY
ncbi:MAG: transporter substrate-binding domain-containing protein [Methylovirgula sp.]